MKPDLRLQREMQNSSIKLLWFKKKKNQSDFFQDRIPSSAS